MSHKSLEKEKSFRRLPIPVSDARRDDLRAVEEDVAARLEKAGLAGANILCLKFFTRLEGVGFEGLLIFALSKSVVKCE